MKTVQHGARGWRSPSAQAMRTQEIVEVMGSRWLSVGGSVGRPIVGIWDGFMTVITRRSAVSASTPLLSRAMPGSDVTPDSG